MIKVCRVLNRSSLMCKLRHLRLFTLSTSIPLIVRAMYVFCCFHNQFLSLVVHLGTGCWPGTTGTAYVTHIGFLIILGDQVYHGSVVTMVFVLCFYTVMCVYRQYSRGLMGHPCGAPVLRMRLLEVKPLNFNTCDQTS